MGMWKYASDRSMDAAHYPGLIRTRIDSGVSIRNEGISMVRFRVFRSISCLPCHVADFPVQYCYPDRIGRQFGIAKDWR